MNAVLARQLFAREAIAFNGCRPAAQLIARYHQLREVRQPASRAALQDYPYLLRNYGRLIQYGLLRPEL